MSQCSAQNKKTRPAKAGPGYPRAALAVFVWGHAETESALRPQAGFDLFNQIGAMKLYVKSSR
jgi:hypothetical protein